MYICMLGLAIHRDVWPGAVVAFNTVIIYSRCIVERAHTICV